MGVLDGVKVIEVAGIGPGPFAAMMLADMGADVLRVDRPAGGRGLSLGNTDKDVLARGRRSVALDLKAPEGLEVLMDLVATADVLLEGYRPGVAERLGFGPDDCHARNERLVYGRMTGWGQDGPQASRAGHDLTYLSTAGVVAHMQGRDGAPAIPINLVGDFGGGGMLLVVGVLGALIERGISGRGQVVDAAIVDGAALQMAMVYGMRAGGLWPNARGGNILDGGAPFYDHYRCSDGGYVAVGALEPQFYAELMKGLGLEGEEIAANQWDMARWPEWRARIGEVFATRTRDEWAADLEATDACVAAVLDMEESARHPHNKARGLHIDAFGVTQPAPAPRFSRTPSGTPTPPATPGQHSAEALADWGVDRDRIAKLQEAGVVHQT
ncbi:alpha-methylacyl-CoA racemase [Actinomycetospora succinea]|uniref:Alpha-methylacyl-CoA racemase n=1 Tax=Actinomycetospora succinea TaxID=663603 RepID=A0A4R6ULM3_9PSEU|nr:CaiB/BaiF CoA-transferase family protein [Actinomycetospora succinea]TDQ47930.1 alpha-methylacyl-CoA racemase [Actinomycetospora succinea]